jgi:hypothetical protein
VLLYKSVDVIIQIGGCVYADSVLLYKSVDVFIQIGSCV